MNAEQQTSPTLEIVTTRPAGVDPVLQKLALSRFETTFRLEGELVGKGKVKVSKKGGVTLSLKNLSSKDGTGLDVATGLKGDALESYRQKLALALKTEFGVQATRLTADNRYEAGKMVIAPNGSVVLEWKPIKDETIVAISEKSAMAALGLTEDEMAEIQLKREAKAHAEEMAKVEPPTPAPEVAAASVKNGEVKSIVTPAK